MTDVGRPLDTPSEYVEALSRTAQYVAGLTHDANIWDEFTRVAHTFLRTDVAAFVGRRSDGSLVVHGLFVEGPVCPVLDICRPVILQVFESGFLVTESVVFHRPYTVTVLPLTVGSDRHAMIIAHQDSGAPSRDLLNVYLAVAGLMETALSRLASQHLLLRLAGDVPLVLFQLTHYPGDEWRFSYVSHGAAVVLGIDSTALMAVPGRFLDHLPPEVGGDRLAALAPSHPRSRPLVVEMPWPAPDGGSRTLLVKAVGESPADGSVVWDGSIEDITALREAETERARQAERLKDALIQTVQVLSLTVEKRDPYTAGHQRQVAALAAAIGRELDLPADRMEGLYLGGLVHDIGKVAIPAELLSKPSRLTALECELLHTHCQAGYDIIKDVDFPWPIAEMIRQHHERFDGSGYPRGLKGDEILLEARILAVADVIDAMLSHRPYRPKRSLTAARAEIRGGAGASYDPAVAAAALRLLRRSVAARTEFLNT